MTLALLQYLNTPLRGINKSPAQLATGRQLRDGVPMARRHLLIDRFWKKTIRRRELQMAKLHKSIRYLDTTRKFSPIKIGAHVRVQNQANNKWDRTGTVTEVKPHRQYIIKLDGSGRLSLRNRRHIKEVAPPPATSQPPTVPSSALPPTTLPPPITESDSDVDESRPESAVQPTESSIPFRPKRAVNKPKWFKDYV